MHHWLNAGRFMNWWVKYQVKFRTGVHWRSQQMSATHKRGINICEKSQETGWTVKPWCVFFVADRYQMYSAPLPLAMERPFRERTEKKCLAEIKSNFVLLSFSVLVLREKYSSKQSLKNPKYSESFFHVMVLNPSFLASIANRDCKRVAGWIHHSPCGC